MEEIVQAAEYVMSKLAGLKPEVGIVLGSGLGKLADMIENPVVIPYSTIPNFPVSTAIGHKGNFIVGEFGGKTVCAMQGRFHYYEGYAMRQVTMPVRVMVLMGIKYLFVSNAAGGVNPDYKLGDMMIIRDHINLLPNPLIGPNMEEFGPRFPDMTRPYDLDLIKLAEKIAAEKGFLVHKGVYIAGTGPSYETPAEYKYFRLIGADVVGMSTIPEVITARHCGIPVFGVSVVTNEAHDFADDFENDAQDVIYQADKASDRMIVLFSEMIKNI